MVHKRAVDAHVSTDKKFAHWKTRFKTAAAAFDAGDLAGARSIVYLGLMEAEGLDDKDFAVPASNIALAVVSMEQGKLKEAKELFDKGLNKLKGRPGNDFRELYAAGLRLRALLHERESELDKAEDALIESVELLKKNGEGSAVQLAYSLCDLSYIMVRNDRLDQAEELITLAMEILRATVGEEDPQYDWAKLIYAVCFAKQSDEEQLCDALELKAAKFQYKVGARHPNLIRTLNAYAAALKKRGLAERLAELKLNFSALIVLK